MKTPLQLAVLTLVSAFSLQPSALLAQGSLTPPGAPAPTMKTLAQVEPRTPIAAAPFTISQPGSYYLTTNLTVGSGTAITISSDGVMLDLNGFTIRSTAASAVGYGIMININRRNISIANGVIESGVTNNGSGVYTGSGFGYGISYSSGTPVNVLVSRVMVVGCQYSGIYLSSGNSTVVESCTVRTAGSYGISASTIKQSVAIDCGDGAIIGKEVSDCRGEANDGTGVSATTALNCYGNSYGNGNGISATTALNCYGNSGSGIGISATTAQNCCGNSDGSGIGISATIAQNCYGNSYGNGTGVSAATALNCYGISYGNGRGVSATTAQNCYGYSNDGYGVYASRTAAGCYGSSANGTGLYAQNAATCTGDRSGGRAISATIANGCYAAAGTNLITFKYNMP
jgi:hypothetical protein